MNCFAVMLLLALAAVGTANAEMLDKNAKAIELAAPSYPAAEKQDRRSGVATVLIHVDAKGTATVEGVMSTLPSFGAAARAAASTWKFEPARQRGVTPVAQTFEFIVVFDAEKGVTMQGPLFRG